MNDDSTAATSHAAGARKRGRDCCTQATETTASTAVAVEEHRDHHSQSHGPPVPHKDALSCKRLRVSACPWSDAMEAPTVWTMVAERMLAKAHALDRSSFGGGADKGHLRAARTLLRVGSTCRALYACIGGLGVRLDVLIGVEDDCEERRLLWCAVARVDVSPHQTTFDTDHVVYHSLLHVERLVMRSGHLCARAIEAPPGRAATDPNTPAADGAARTMVIATEARPREGDIDGDGAGGNDRKENDSKQDDESDDEEEEDSDEEECDSDEDDEDEVEEGRPYKSTIKVPPYQSLWTLINWPGDKDVHSVDKSDSDSESEEYDDDPHEEEEGTLSATDCKGREWTLTIYSHYHHGLTLVDVQIAPRHAHAPALTP